MPLSTAPKRSLLLLLGALITLSLHGTQPTTPAPIPATVIVPTTDAPPVIKSKRKVSFSFTKKVKALVKQYALFYKSLKKKYGGSVVGSTILIAVLLGLGIGAILYLLAHAGISGLLVTILALLGFAAIVYWAVRRIRWNS